ncbi:hypothetical protein [uncultured Duncaniella sp.]|uniref:hypothetical protein n=2 Tax=uncultured Duncaniella sp. TaxID=2768039 RepID=UPI00264876A9|nr:hypothetical protein [uncultured Duncaniella sp.]
MVKTIVSIIILSAASALCSAQEQADTLKAQELNEVVVQAQMQRTSSAKSTYTPTGRQKNAAQNAVDLLRQMAIPQIRINPIDETVTDNVGGSVAIYINFLEASKEEMEGLRTADVRRVEYLEFPTDPRFRGAERVINIIVQEYAYGGYTKVTANENFLVGLSSRVNIFSKFSYKKMTYDLYAGANNWNNHHIGSTTEGIYRLTGVDGKEFSLTRKETLESSHYKQNQYPVTFRATYNSDKIQIRNLLAFTNLGIPTNEYSGKLEYSPNSAQGYSFDRKNPNRSNSVAYSGTYFFALPKGYSVDFSPSFNYTHSNDYTDYAASEQPAIYRHAKENAYNYRLNLYIRKSFGQKHSVMLGGNYGDNINRLEYTGDNGYRDKFHNAFGAGMVGYNFQAQKISVNLDAGLAWENSDINGKKNSDTYPFTHINVRYVPNQKNSFSAYFQYATNSPGISEKSSDILRENELMYITGNPLLENSRHTTINLAYTWMPSNAFGMSAYGRYFGLYDRQLLVYTPYKGGQALLRSYINDGDYLNGEIGLVANWKLLDGKLQLYANPGQSFYKSTGIFNDNCNSFRVTAQAIYYIDSFYFQAYYESPQKSMFTASPRINKGRNFHSVTVGWANANWNLRVMAANFFNKGWDGATTATISPYYNERQTVIGTSSHPRINFTATYTFGYGKKVQRGNEVGEQSGAASAILK